MNDWLIVANGVPVSSDCLVRWVENRSVCVCDGAYSGFKQENIGVDLLVGDFDSVDTGDLSRCRHSPVIECHQLFDQAKTDLEKRSSSLTTVEQPVLSWFRQRVIVLITRCTTFVCCAVFIVNHALLYLVNDHELISFHRDCDIKLAGTRLSQCVSIMAMDTAIISTQGLLYDMARVPIEADRRDSVSSSLSRSQAICHYYR